MAGQLIDVDSGLGNTLRFAFTSSHGNKLAIDEFRRPQTDTCGHRLGGNGNAFFLTNDYAETTTAAMQIVLSGADLHWRPNA